MTVGWLVEKLLSRQTSHQGRTYQWKDQMTLKVKVKIIHIQQRFSASRHTYLVWIRKHMIKIDDYARKMAVIHTHVLHLVGPVVFRAGAGWVKSMVIPSDTASQQYFLAFIPWWTLYTKVKNYFFTLWPFLPKGHCRHLGLSMCLSPSPCWRDNSRTIQATYSPYMQQICIMVDTQTLFTMDELDLDLQGHYLELDPRPRGHVLLCGQVFLCFKLQEVHQWKIVCVVFFPCVTSKYNHFMAW